MRDCVPVLMRAFVALLGQLVWRFSKEAVALRVRHLVSLPLGSDSHTVLVQDIPGIDFGTPLQRADATLLCVFPAFIRRRVSCSSFWKIAFQDADAPGARAVRSNA